MTITEEIVLSLLEEFQEIPVEEAEMSSFMGLICCCNTVKEPRHDRC